MLIRLGTQMMVIFSWVPRISVDYMSLLLKLAQVGQEKRRAYVHICQD